MMLNAGFHIWLSACCDHVLSVARDVKGGKVRKEWGVPKDLLGLLEGRQTYVIGECHLHHHP